MYGEHHDHSGREGRGYCRSPKCRHLGNLTRILEVFISGLFFLTNCIYNNCISMWNTAFTELYSSVTRESMA